MQLKTLTLRHRTNETPPFYYVVEGLDLIVTEWRQIYHDNSRKKRGVIVLEGYHPFDGLMKVSILLTQREWDKLKLIDVEDTDYMLVKRSNQGEIQ